MTLPKGTTETHVLPSTIVLRREPVDPAGPVPQLCHDSQLIESCLLSQLCTSFVTMFVISRDYSTDRTRYREVSMLIFDECRRRRLGC